MTEILAQGRITGVVYDNHQKALEGVNIVLHTVSDSSFLEGAVSQPGGIFLVRIPATGSYLLSFSFAGFTTHYLTLKIQAQADSVLPAIRLQPADKTLENVIITAYKPMFEQKIDRLVVNVKNSITSTGGTVLNVLQRSPGILIDRQSGAISLNGKSGVQVMINGKMSYVPAEALISMLEGMSADNVEKIELISTPPARFDAGGAAGYINIVLIKNPNEGFNGNLSLTMAAFHGTSPMANLDFNYRKKKSNFYGGVGSSRQAQKQFFKNYRRISLTHKTVETNMFSKRDPSQFNNNIRLGYDYEWSKRTTVGVLVSAYNNFWKMNAYNESYTLINNQTDTVARIHNSEKNHWQHAMGNLNLQHRLTDQDEISFNLDYLFYNNVNPTDYRNHFYDGDDLFLYTEQMRSNKRTTIKMLPVQADYKGKIHDKMLVETGLKAVFNRFTNDVDVAHQKDNDWIADTEFSAAYQSRETILAAYFSTHIAANEKNSFQAGLRYEYTNSNLGTVTRPNIIDRKYGEWFPTLYWSHIINSSNSLNLSYTRRINRPSFNDLAPFVSFWDPKTFISGNSELQPSFANTIKADYTFRRFVFSISYAHEKYAIGRFQLSMDTSSNKQYLTAQNLDYLSTLSASMAMPFTLTPWWKLQLAVTLNRQQAKASYTKSVQEVRLLNSTVSGFQNFDLGKQYNLELSGYYQTKMLFGAVVIKPLSMLNMAVRKKFAASGSTLTLGVDNIFSSNAMRVSSDVPEERFLAEGFLQFQKRIFKLTYSFRFGNSSLKEKRKRSTASDEEQKRVD